MSSLSLSTGLPSPMPLLPPPHARCAATNATVGTDTLLPHAWCAAFEFHGSASCLVRNTVLLDPPPWSSAGLDPLPGHTACWIHHRAAWAPWIHAARSHHHPRCPLLLLLCASALPLRAARARLADASTLCSPLVGGVGSGRGHQEGRGTRMGRGMDATV